jgi:hypothetical protein
MSEHTHPRDPYVGAPDSRPATPIEEHPVFAALSPEARATVARNEANAWLAANARPVLSPDDYDVVSLSLVVRVPDRPTLDAQESLVAILRKLADRIESGAAWDDACETRTVLDGLGNSVGHVTLDVDYAEEVLR